MTSPFATPTTAEGEAFTSMLRHIGLTSPVTRAVAGALYNQELARQLADFLRYLDVSDIVFGLLHVA